MLPNALFSRATAFSISGIRNGSCKSLKTGLKNLSASSTEEIPRRTSRRATIGLMPNCSASLSPLCVCSSEGVRKFHLSVIILFSFLLACHIPPYDTARMPSE
ncbi:hypothetical protein Barb7_02804 [Bacteroidales bacterium Barb7]|nr:hypothetical protein Barb7_02804 [Bacteroidales bacterium Barb7]